VLGDEIPVAHIGGSRGDGAAEAGECGPVHQRHPGGDDGQQHEQGGQEPARTPEPEVAQIQAAFRTPLPEQQVGDQIPAQGEEDPDTEQPSPGPPELKVVADDGEHRQRPQAIEAGQVALAAADRFRHVSPLPPCGRPTPPVRRAVNSRDRKRDYPEQIKDYT
jgi:hypothetical protein